MHSVIMPIGRNINESGGKKHGIKEVIPGNWLKGEEIIKAWTTDRWIMRWDKYNFGTVEIKRRNKKYREWKMMSRFNIPSFGII